MIIYKVTNRINGKIYIGQTIQPLVIRWDAHTRKGCVLYAAIQKYGKENFTVEQIDTATSRDELDQKEQYWIAHYDCIAPKGYNLTSGGRHYEFSDEVLKKKLENAPRGEKHPMFGKHHSDETKRKLSLAFTGSKNHRFGTKMTPEHKAKLLKINLGKKASEDTKRKMSESQMGDKNHFYGKTHNDEARTKISHSRKQYVGIKHPRCRAVRCLNTGEVYPYIRKASEATGVHETHISSCCKGKLSHAGGLKWEYV